VAQYYDVYELMRVRLRSVGPSEARFDDVIVDLCKPWGDAAKPEGHTSEADDEVRTHSAHSTVIIGENGVGKSTLLRLISSVLVRPRPLRGAL